ncbi:888_t:CDS:1, partial [Funneliformis geosporum]
MPAKPTNQKFCYVCLKQLGFAKVVLNPKSKLARYICLNTTANP